MKVPLFASGFPTFGVIAERPERCGPPWALVPGQRWRRAKVPRGTSNTSSAFLAEYLEEGSRRARNGQRCYYRGT